MKTSEEIKSNLDQAQNALTYDDHQKAIAHSVYALTLMFYFVGKEDIERAEEKAESDSDS